MTQEATAGTAAVPSFDTITRLLSAPIGVFISQFLKVGCFGSRKTLAAASGGQGERGIVFEHQAARPANGTLASVPISHRTDFLRRESWKYEVRITGLPSQGFSFVQGEFEHAFV